MAEKKVKKNEKKLAVCPRLCYTTGMKDKEIQKLSDSYWQALEDMDYAWADFYASALEMMGAQPLKKN